MSRPDLPPGRSDRASAGLGNVAGMEIREVAVIGIGTMGAGIAEVLARGGLQVVAIEADAAALARGMAILDRSLARAVARGKLTGQEQADIAGRVRPAGGLDDAATADLAIEVVPEQMEIKRQVLGGLDQACRPDAILATNTSSLSVTAIAAGTSHPGRVVGMHFFNPAPVMRLVEVVTTVLTEPGTGEAVAHLARRLGKTPLLLTDRAGFVANALLLPYLNHAVTLLETGYATRDDIDAAASAGIGLPMGPLALLDLIGLDTSLSVLRVLHGEFGGPRYSPAPLLRRLADAGRLGRKSGSGFYDYGKDPGPATPGIVRNAPVLPAPVTITLIDAGASPAGDPAGQSPARPGQGGGLADLASAGTGPAAELAGMIAAAGIDVQRDPGHPGDLAVVAASPGGSVLTAALAAGRSDDAVGLRLAGGGLAELVTTRLTSDRAVATAMALAGKLGMRLVRCPDRPGFLVGALLYPHLADAVRMVQDGYATAADIDTAMTMGCGYPRGPMQILDEVGPAVALSVLRAMHDRYGDPAFAPPPLLAEHAAAELKFCS
jgi:3-hydroxybutyryl-CoA dehydrogenase